MLKANKSPIPALFQTQLFRLAAMTLFHMPCLFCDMGRCEVREDDPSEPTVRLQDNSVDYYGSEEIANLNIDWSHLVWVGSARQWATEHLGALMEQKAWVQGQQ